MSTTTASPRPSFLALNRALLGIGLAASLCACGLPLHYGRLSGPGQYTTDETRNECGAVIPKGSSITDSEKEGEVRVRFAEGGEAFGVALLPETEATFYHRRFLWDSNCFLNQIEVVAGQPWGGLVLESGEVIRPAEIPEASKLALKTQRQLGDQSYPANTWVYFDAQGNFRRAETPEAQHAANDRANARAEENRRNRAQCVAGCAPLAITPQQQCEAKCRYNFP